MIFKSMHVKTTLEILIGQLVFLTANIVYPMTWT